MLAEIIETKLNYINPFKITNHSERAFGITKERYFTRECKNLRSLNSEFISANKPDRKKIFEYLYSLEMPAVIKDPQFCFTLNYWYKAAFDLNLNPLIIFTNRDEDEMKKSWVFAPYTKNLFENGRFRSFIDALNIQRRIAKKNNFSYINIQKLSKN
jgi:hypothetical protein